MYNFVNKWHFFKYNLDRYNFERANHQKTNYIYYIYWAFFVYCIPVIHVWIYHCAISWRIFKHMFTGLRVFSSSSLWKFWKLRKKRSKRGMIQIIKLYYTCTFQKYNVLCSRLLLEILKNNSFFIYFDTSDLIKTRAFWISKFIPALRSIFVTKKQ